MSEYQKELDDVTKIIFDNIKDYDYGLFNKETGTNAPRINLYNGKYIQLTGVKVWNYYIINGLREEDFNQLTERYNKEILDEMKEEYIQDLIKDGIVEKVDDN